MSSHSDLAHLPAYDAVYVVSDLHLGGYEEKSRDYRIFRSTDALAWLIKGLAGIKHRRVALVLNGDIVDFLADRDPDYFDWTRAVDKLRGAVTDPAQEAVWDALREFVKVERHDLVLVLGNHDLELALPGPQHYLANTLTDGDRAQGRLIFATDGAGFACRVGGARVLCLHGNEVDPWNAIDYGRLSLIRRALARGSRERNRRILGPWIPCPGTQMVIDHLNEAKRQYQWLDLLKPEEEAAAMIAAALRSMPGLRSFVEMVREKGRVADDLEQGFLGGGDPSYERLDPQAPIAADAAQHDPDRLILDALDRLRRGVTPVELAREEEESFLVSWQELRHAARIAKLAAWPRGLKATLLHTLAKDHTFDPHMKDATFTELDRLCGRDIDFLVAGHTHLHRAIVRESGGYYYNSGTWIQLLHLPRAALDDDVYPEVEQRLRSGGLAELEREIATRQGKISLLRPTRTVVCIERSGDGVDGCLQTVESDGPSWKRCEVRATRFRFPGASA